MDIIIEGILTKEEGMNDVLETIMYLKSVSNILLRVSCKEEALQGRISFGTGGYILGGCIDGTNETGYPAIKKLLTVCSGNYAILDTGREIPPEVNQTLYLKAEKILETWPNLPDSGDTLLGSTTSLSLLPAFQNAPAAPHEAEKKNREREEIISRIRSRYRSKAYQQNVNHWHLALKLSWLIISLILVLVIVQYASSLFVPGLKVQHHILQK